MVAGQKESYADRNENVKPTRIQRRTTQLIIEMPMPEKHFKP